MPLPVAAAFLSPSPLTVGTFADAVGKACRVDTGDGTVKGVAIGASVAVGSRVRLTEQTGDDKARRVTVKIEG